MNRSNFCSQNYFAGWTSPLLLAAIAVSLSPSPSNALPANLEYRTHSNFSQANYGTTVYGGSTSYGSYNSSGFGVHIDGYSREYPYTYPSFYHPGYSTGTVITQPIYPYYPVYPHHPEGFNKSVLIHPTVINGRFYKPTLVNPTIIGTPRSVGSRSWSRTTVIRYPVPYGASGVTIQFAPRRAYPYPH